MMARRGPRKVGTRLAPNFKKRQKLADTGGHVERDERVPVVGVPAMSCSVFVPPSPSIAPVMTEAVPRVIVSLPVLMLTAPFTVPWLVKVEAVLPVNRTPVPRPPVITPPA